MSLAFTLLVIVLVLAVAFDFINGFHDTANAIATVVATRVLTPSQAIIMAAPLNFVGAMTGTAVAKTIASGLVPATLATQPAIIAALLAAIVFGIFSMQQRVPNGHGELIAAPAGDYKVRPDDPGGLKVEDPSIDLSVLVALLSSYEDRTVPQNICFAGEVGLSGEISAVNRMEQRIAEAEKLGFEKIIVSKYGQKGLSSRRFHIEVITMGRVEEVYKHLF